MDLLKNLTIKNLKLNKKRTIVTIIGIILSVALITAVASMFFSARESLIEFEMQQEGNYHYGFSDVPAEDLETFKLNRKIENIYITKALGYATIEGIKNEYKPYAYVKAYSQESLENLGVNLIEGRLPENENEIVIPSHLKTNGGVTLNVGETIKLNIGKRVSDGEELNQSNPFVPDVKEEIINQEAHTYTIVGIMERPSSRGLEAYSAPGYTFITYLASESEITGKVDVYIRYTQSSLKEHAILTANILNVDEIAFDKVYGSKEYTLSQAQYNEAIEMISNGKYEFHQKDYLITLESGLIKDSTLQALATAVVIVIIIIIATSVFCIKNSFDISITEKTKQYGMLASVGATKKQIKRNVYYEAFILGLIGIPIGILCGLVASYILIIVNNHFLKQMLTFELIFSFSWLSILFAITLGVITIYLSARRSAKRASKIAPIVAIRNSENIKINPKKVKSPKYINKIFGIGGEISYKNLKRSKKKYRTTVISITVCVTVFIALYSFMNLAFDVVKAEYQTTDYNLTFSYRQSKGNDVKSKLDTISKLNTVKRFSSIKSDTFYFMTDDYSKEYLEINPNISNTHTNKEENFYNVNEAVSIKVVGDEEYIRYIKKLGLNYDEVADKCILINDVYEYTTINERTVQVQVPKYNLKAGDTISGDIDVYTSGNEYETRTFNLEIAKITTEVPMGVNKYNYNAVIIVSEKFAEKYMKEEHYEQIYIDSSDCTKTQDDIEEILKDNSYSLSNIGENVQMMESFYTLIAIFLYGFIIVIALIGITNIFNTVTTNMNLRRREFAMLKSIGMTNKEFNRMIRLESFFYGTKSLAIGIPLGCILSYAIYDALMSGDLIIKYRLPIGAIIISILAVFILITVIMKYSMRKINNQNTIETIRNENI